MMRLLDVVRSLAFYLAFFVGSVGYVAAAFVAMLLHPPLICKIGAGWSAWHRSCAKWLLGLRVEIDGKVPSGKVLVAIKHESHFEAIDLPCLLDRPAVFAKAELRRVPFWGKTSVAYGLIMVERDQGAKALRKMLAEAKARLAEGRVLAIFPEGTRVPHGERRELQAGFAGLYKLLGLPVVPVAVASGAKYHRRWKRPGVIRVQFGETIEPGLPREVIEARVLDAINVLNGSQANPPDTAAASHSA